MVKNWIKLHDPGLVYMYLIFSFYKYLDLDDHYYNQNIYINMKVVF